LYHDKTAIWLPNKFIPLKYTIQIFMKKLIAYMVLPLVLLLNACQEEKTFTDKNTTATKQNINGLELQDDNNAEWQHGMLRLYPILADEELIADHAGQAHIKTLSDAMVTKGFRITEVKQFGREQTNWYNGLTLVNKSKDTVYVMSGDVVTGGNQDRVNSEDLMAMPGTIRNIDVFCVEHGRSTYYNPNADAVERKLAAFNGYYGIASPRVRKAVYDKDQSAVWGAVAQVTKDNNAASSTQTYAALEQENDMKEAREAYIRFFTSKFENMPNVVGLVAVCNGKVIGTEVFGHPALFQRRVKALVHGYAVDAATATKDENPTDDTAAAKRAFSNVVTVAANGKKGTEEIGRFDFGGDWVHIYKK
jgi:hypothetical protein